MNECYDELNVQQPWSIQYGFCIENTASKEFTDSSSLSITIEQNFEYFFYFFLFFHFVAKLGLDELNMLIAQAHKEFRCDSAVAV